MRPARPGGGAAVGAAQHRRVRRRPGQGHDRWRVRRRLVGVRADDLATGSRPVSGAIMESGSCPSRSPAAALSAGLAFVSQAGCGVAASAAACLRNTAVSALLSSAPARAMGRSSPRAGRTCPCRPPRRSLTASTQECRFSWEPTMTRAGPSRRGSRRLPCGNTRASSTAPTVPRRGHYNQSAGAPS